jgi:hypothetical protein
MTAIAIGLIVITVVVYNDCYGFLFMAATRPPGPPY